MNEITEEQRAEAEEFSKKVFEKLIHDLRERGWDITEIQDADSGTDSEPSVISRGGFFIAKGEEKEEKDTTS